MGQWLLRTFVILLVSADAAAAWAQVYVMPRRGGQSMVHSFDFAWRTVDITPDVHTVREVLPPRSGTEQGEGAESDTPGRVRLYFYEHERRIAERAAGRIDASYRSLAERFRYLPRATFPYILYSSYQEFLQTNLFPMQEGVLGVTSPIDLTLTLPYLGDDRLFNQVSTHELAHQFTIQKVRTLARRTFAGGDPLEALPLWFIEGLAELYAHHGVDAETDMLVRDLLVSPRDELPNVTFFRDDVRGYLWTYKLGQLRCAFLEAVYGEGTIQKILDHTPLLVGSHGGVARLGRFDTLLTHLTGDDPDVIVRKFDAWIRQRLLPPYLDAPQGDAWMTFLPDVRDHVEAMGSRGDLLVYRAVDETTGLRSIVLADARAPGQDVTVAEDNAPGIESLHPIWDRSFDVTDTALVFVAEAEGRDILYWQTFTHRAEALPPVEDIPTSEGTRVRVPDAVLGPDDRWRMHWRLGRRRAFAMAAHGLIGAFSPALSPDGRRVAFIGLDMSGQRDVYILEPRIGEAYHLTRLTRDMYTERELAWGPTGIVYTSDATGDGWFNLFVVDPEGGPPRRLTNEFRDVRAPTFASDGRVLFVAFDTPGRANLYELGDRVVVRRTDLAGGLYDPSPGTGGDAYALLHRGAERRMVRLPRAGWADGPSTSVGQDTRVPHVVPRLALDGAQPYDATALRNWEFNNLMGFLGISGTYVAGAVIASASDRLRNQAVIASVYAYGSLQLTDGFLLYVNQAHRTTVGVGPFQSVRLRFDTTFPEIAAPWVSFERFYGGQVTLRYPFSRFAFLQGDLQLGGAEAFLGPDGEAYLQDGAATGAGQDLRGAWHARNGGHTPQAATVLTLGYDTVGYNRATGPFLGSALLLELAAYHRPLQRAAFGTARLDGAHFFPLVSSANFFIRGGAGASLGGHLARQFYLSSFDTLRAVPFGGGRGSLQYLLGRDYYFATAELQLPLSAIIRVILLSNLEGIVGLDFGGAGDTWRAALEHRVLDLALGVNLGLGPLVFRLHFARPFDIGVPLPLVGWNINASLGWLYL
jgi:hypothetical protein